MQFVDQVSVLVTYSSRYRCCNRELQLLEYSVNKVFIVKKMVQGAENKSVSK